MAATFQAAGGFTGGNSGSLTVDWPAHDVDDIGILVIESAPNATVTLTTPNGFTLVDSAVVGSAATACGLSVWWARATSSSMPGPVMNGNTGNHVLGVIITARGAVATGSPIHAYAFNDVTAGSSPTIAGVTTTVAGCLMVNGVGNPTDAGAAFASGWNNATTGKPTERVDGGTTAGNGGEIALATRTFTGVGSSGDTTVTLSGSWTGPAFCLAIAPAVSVATAAAGTSTAGAAGKSSALAVAAPSSGVATASAAARVGASTVTPAAGNATAAVVGAAQVAATMVPSAGAAAVSVAGFARAVAVPGSIAGGAMAGAGASSVAMASAGLVAGTANVTVSGAAVASSECTTAAGNSTAAAAGESRVLTVITAAAGSASASVGGIRAISATAVAAAGSTSVAAVGRSIAVAAAVTAAGNGQSAARQVLTVTQSGEQAQSSSAGGSIVLIVATSGAQAESGAAHANSVIDAVADSGQAQSAQSMGRPSVILVSGAQTQSSSSELIFYARASLGLPAVRRGQADIRRPAVASMARPAEGDTCRATTVTSRPERAPTSR